MKNDESKYFPLLDPHFFSNTLNAIEGLVNMKKNRAASKYLVHFSRLSRRLMSTEPGISTDLADELKVMEHFLALERLRAGAKLTYEISSLPDAKPGRLRVPAFIFQPYLEQAIWYGILPKSEPGKLRIYFSLGAHDWKCIIEDDGIGREAARRQRAASVLKPVDTWSKLTANNYPEFGEIKTEAIDLTDENGQTSGTRIIITLPYQTHLR